MSSCTHRTRTRRASRGPSGPVRAGDRGPSDSISPPVGSAGTSAGRLAGGPILAAVSDRTTGWQATMSASLSPAARADDSRSERAARARASVPRATAAPVVAFSADGASIPATTSWE